MKASSARRAVSSDPVTFGIIAVSLVLFLAVWFRAFDWTAIYPSLMFVGQNASQSPWVMLTYWLAPTSSILALLLGSFILWQFGGQLETQLGSRQYGLMLLVWLTLSGAVGFVASMLGVPVVMGGMTMLVSFAVMIWCGRFPTASINLFGMLPVPAWGIALLTAVISLLQQSPPLAAVLVTVPVVLSYYWALDRLPIPFSATRKHAGTTFKFSADPKRQERAEREYLDKVKDREKERAERERLRKLFEGGQED
ncbi:MAG: hypothetical protein JNM85_01125 [Chthonomonas sp.]|nr:hypothetical protein [Chthonomonas sp.]